MRLSGRIHDEQLEENEINQVRERREHDRLECGRDRVDDREPKAAHPARRRTERRMVPYDLLGGSAGRDGEGVLEDVGSEGGSGEWLKNQKQPILVL